MSNTIQTRQSNPKMVAKLEKTRAEWKEIGHFFKTYKKTHLDAIEELPEEEREDLVKQNQLNTAVFNCFRGAGGVYDKEKVDQFYKDRGYRVAIYSHADWSLIKFKNGTIKLQNEALLQEANEATSIQTEEDINVLDF